ncbi:ThuA domain-containing protein [Haloferula sp.]|uniref:ThuA domain-containing protein n=1 Tax=Haloferula sp. TaxID=2497595 RepID=UPI003C753329
MTKLLSLAIFLLALNAPLVAAPKKGKPANSAGPAIKALLITGGCCHDYDTQREIIPAAIDSQSKYPVEWTIFHQRTEAGDMLLEFYKNPDWAKGYDIVVHNECFANVGDVDYIAGILKPHLEGTPAVLVHCTMHCYRKGPIAEDWWKFCGVHSPGHGPKHPFEVEITNKEHEITKGMENWTTPNGELYYINKIYPTATPLAQSMSEAKKKMFTNIWVNAYGPKKTRVFGTTIGHHNETMLQENYMDMITRGFLWAAGKPVAENIK